MGPKTTPSLISKGGYQIPPPLGGREIDTPWEIGLKDILLKTALSAGIASSGGIILRIPNIANRERRARQEALTYTRVTTDLCCPSFLTSPTRLTSASPPWALRRGGQFLSPITSSVRAMQWQLKGTWSVATHLMREWTRYVYFVILNKRYSTSLSNTDPKYLPS